MMPSTAKPILRSGGPAKPVMVVEDDTDLRQAIADTLKAAGYSVVEACDGLAALEVLKTNRPALLLLDMMMPRMSGLEVLRAMRADACWSSIPVIVMTALSAALPEGVSLMRKPVSAEMILAATRRVLENAG